MQLFLLAFGSEANCAHPKSGQLVEMPRITRLKVPGRLRWSLECAGYVKTRSSDDDRSQLLAEYSYGTFDCASFCKMMVIS